MFKGLQIAAISLCAISACSGVRGQLPARKQPSAATGTLQVGAAAIDITPPPGFQLANGDRRRGVSQGTWTRLKARAIVFEDRKGVPLAMVSVDLWAVSGALSDRVAELVSAKHGLATLAREQIIIAATGTHHAPGRTETASAVAVYAGARGFDPKLLEFLAQRIAHAIATAHAERKPAQLHRYDVGIPTLLRNRDVQTFATNPEAAALLRAHFTLPSCLTPEQRGQGPDPCHAVNPVFTALVAKDARSMATIAILGVLATEATVLTRLADVYSGDLFAVASSAVERDLGHMQSTPAVVALFSGAGADTLPNASEPTRPATLEMGQLLAGSIAQTLESPSSPVEGTIGVSQVRVGFSDAQIPSASSARTQRRRRPPTVAPVGIAQIGPFVLATVPGAITTAIGHRIERRIAAVHPDIQPVVPVARAGAFVADFTTPEEFDALQRAGAFVPFGRQAGTLLVDRIGQIASRPQIGRDPNYRYRARRKVDWRGSRRQLRSGPKAYTELLLLLDANIRATPTLVFSDELPAWPTAPTDPATPRVWAEQQRPDGSWQTLASDEGPDFLVVAAGLHDANATWSAGWLRPTMGQNPPAQLASAPGHLSSAHVSPGHASPAHASGPIRLHVRRVAGSDVCSAPFDVARALNAELSRALAHAECES